MPWLLTHSRSRSQSDRLVSLERLDARRGGARGGLGGRHLRAQLVQLPQQLIVPPPCAREIGAGLDEIWNGLRRGDGQLEGGSRRGGPPWAAPGPLTTRTGSYHPARPFPPLISGKPPQGCPMG